MSTNELREKYLKFFESRGHKAVPSSSLLSDDPSVLLTTAGMQQFKPYFVGEGDPEKDFGGKNTTSVQKAFRTSDIDEVGDESHLTFFEMLGNFSFGGYFKEEAIKLAHEFITKELGLVIDYVSVFEGDPSMGSGQAVPADEKSEEIWRALGVSDIRAFNREENFWGPTGSSGPCGPTTEVYIKDLEIWNIVFNEFFCNEDGSLTPLDTPGVDTGMGLERLAMVVGNKQNIFETDIFSSILEKIPTTLDENKRRIIVDHVRGIAFLISDGIRPSNKEAGYILRRLIRRVVVYGEGLDMESLLSLVVKEYGGYYKELNKEAIILEYKKESELFKKTLERGLKEMSKLDKVDAREAFKLYETFGLPFEIIKDKFASLDRGEFDKEFAAHQEVSRAGAGTFKGGLADEAPDTIRLHTAHHLLLAALQEVLGSHVKQKGSNVTSERLRIDFSHSQKMSSEELERVEHIVNQKIEEGLDVERREMPKEEAEELGAEMEFGKKYGDIVMVYVIVDDKGKIFSKEFCGGPHVANTSEIGGIRITKESSASAVVNNTEGSSESREEEGTALCPRLSKNFRYFSLSSFVLIQ